MKHTVELANQIAVELRAIPPKDPAKRRLNKQGMVRLLAKEIVALQQRGYTIEEVVESLHGRGLDITTPTLKSYLQRAKDGKGNRQKPGRGPAGTAARTGTPNPASAGGAAGPTPATARAGSPENRSRTTANADPRAAPPSEPGVLRSGKGAFLIKDKDSY